MAGEDGNPRSTAGPPEPDEATDAAAGPLKTNQDDQETGTHKEQDAPLCEPAGDAARYEILFGLRGIHDPAEQDKLRREWAEEDAWFKAMGIREMTEPCF